VESGKWKVESGKWKVESGKWKVESGKWKVESGVSGEKGKKKVGKSSEYMHLETSNKAQTRYLHSH